MAALVSNQMKEALALLKKNPAMTAYRAAQLTGITRSAISQNAAYRELINARKGLKNAQ